MSFPKTSSRGFLLPIVAFLCVMLSFFAWKAEVLALHVYNETRLIQSFSERVNS